MLMLKDAKTKTEMSKKIMSLAIFVWQLTNIGEQNQSKLKRAKLDNKQVHRPLQKIVKNRLIFKFLNRTPTYQTIIRKIESGIMEEINPLKKINLEQYQKPKTLIVVHYKGKRISVPLLGDCKNLTEMLYHHIDKFEQTVLKNDQKWEILSEKKIVCFCSSSNPGDKPVLTKTHNTFSNSIKKNIQRFLTYPDGELKIDILLSIIRIESQSKRPVLDITKFYKYMEIQPYYIEYPLSNGLNEKENPMKHKYYLYRLLEKNRVKNTYMARSLENGYFYSMKVFRSGLGMAEHEARFLTAINNKMDSRYPEYMRNYAHEQTTLSFMTGDIIPKTQIYMIPSEEEEDQQDESNEPQYKHLAIIHKYNIKGKLSARIHDKNIKITENDLLKYLKQLVWIVNQLHEEYNIIHRNLTPEAFEIDQLGDLKLVSFSSWLECYDQNGRIIDYPLKKNSNRSDYSHESRIYEQEFELVSDGWYNIGHYTPPQVLSRSKDGYNKFVDYYTIGIIIKEIYQKIYEFQVKSQNSTTSALIQKMISCLTSQSLQQRNEIASELVESIKKSQLQDTQRKHKHISLNLNEIRLGQFINVDINQTCVQNQDNDFEFNGISHQEIIKYFKPIKELKSSVYQQNGSQYQAKQSKSKEKKKVSHLMKTSKNQISSNVSNSRDKSVKSLKSNKSKDKSRTKSKLINEKGEKVQKKSKSKSHQKITSPKRSSFNTNPLVSDANSKLTRGNPNDLSVPSVRKKSKQKSCDKGKGEKSLDKKTKQKKQKALNHTLTGASYDSHESHKIMNRTGGANIPLPRNQYKSPARYA